MAQLKNLDRLKEWTCPAPFNDLMILHNQLDVCCPEWLAEYSPIKMETEEDLKDLKKHWNGPFLNDLRKTVKDGSYSMCSKTTCPRIQRILNMPEKEWQEFKNGPEWLHQYELYQSASPKLVYLNFDEACNLKCPTCRLGLISNQNNKNASKVPILLETFEKQFGRDVRMINLDGAGDVFYSKTFRKWLQEFDPQKFPSLQRLQLFTNGLLFTEKMWNSISKAQPYMKDLFVSIDAASKETYEEIRLGGSWDILLENVDFWLTLPIENIGFNFVAQKKNQHEISDFFYLFHEKAMMSDYRGNVYFHFTMVEDWGHLDLDSYEAMLPDEDVVKSEMIKLRPFFKKIHSNLW